MKTDQYFEYMEERREAFFAEVEALLPYMKAIMIGEEQ